MSMKKYQIPVVNGFVIIITMISLFLAVLLIENAPIVDKFASSLPSRQTVYIFNLIIAASAIGTALFLQIKKDGFTFRQFARMLVIMVLGLLIGSIYLYALGCCDNLETGHGFPVALLVSSPNTDTISMSSSREWILDSLFWFNMSVLGIGIMKIKKLTPLPSNRIVLLLLEILVILVGLLLVAFVFLHIVSWFL
jgi:hypothetical protein